MTAQVDLTMLLPRLDTAPAYAELAQLVRRAGSCRAVQSDLEEAAASLRYFNQIEIDGEEGSLRAEKLETAKALLFHAVVLYSRAVHTSPASTDAKVPWRFNVLGTGHLDTDQRALHAEVIGLRDTVFAHYGGGSADGHEPWIRDHVVAAFSEGDVEIYYPSARTGHTPRVALGLPKLIEAALARLKETGATVEEQLRTSLVAHLDEHPELIDWAL
ncbi:MAG: hypothetical protein PSX37_03510, partial [bacterium]|nr:hypothetical protein [bacterium]